METIERLEAEGQIGSSEAAELRAISGSELEEVKYILKNLGVHVSFGAIFAYDLLPSPLGTISRVLWVAGNRLRFTFFQRDRRRLSVHSMKVLLVSAIPWIGYFAYVIPLRAVDGKIANLCANHISYRLRGESFDTFLEGRSRFVRRLLTTN